MGWCWDGNVPGNCAHLSCYATGCQGRIGEKRQWNEFSCGLWCRLKDATMDETSSGKIMQFRNRCKKVLKRPQTGALRCCEISTNVHNSQQYVKQGKCCRIFRSWCQSTICTRENIPVLLRAPCLCSRVCFQCLLFIVFGCVCFSGIDKTKNKQINRRRSQTNKSESLASFERFIQLGFLI